MIVLTKIFIGIVALEHLYFLVLEMFLWTKPKGLKTFGLKSKEFAEDTKVLAANQGLYNGFLAAGLIYGWILDLKSIILFILACVVIAGIYGAYSTKKSRLFFVQGVPALIALILVYFYY